MRLSNRTDLPDGMDLIKRTLDEDEADATGMSMSTVERLADRIAQGRKPTGRPGALKRHETVIWWYRRALVDWQGGESDLHMGPS